jgi:hypothetical protein
MEITGKLILLLPEVSGESARGPWVRGGFVIETDGDYPRKVAFTAFGEERVAMAKNIPMGTLVQVTFSPESREFNEKWYTDLRASRIQPFVAGQMPPATGYNWNPGTAAAPAAAAPAVPAQQPMAPAAAPTQDFAAAPPQMAPSGEDDLPF